MSFSKFVTKIFQKSFFAFPQPFSTFLGNVTFFANPNPKANSDLFCVASNPQAPQAFQLSQGTKILCANSSSVYVTETILPNPVFKLCKILLIILLLIKTKNILALNCIILIYKINGSSHLVYPL